MESIVSRRCADLVSQCRRALHSGKIWQPLSLTLYCQRRGIRVETTLTSIFLYQVVILLAVAPIAVAYLLLSGNLGPLSAFLPMVAPGIIGIVLAPIVVFLVRPEYLMAILNWGLNKLGRARLETHLSSRRLALLLVAAILTGSCGGPPLRPLPLRSVHMISSRIALIPHLVAAFPIAYAVGFLSLITPSGFGVREGAFYLRWFHC